MPFSDLARRRARITAGVLLGILALYSIYLALNRIYQVDEAQNVFTARILASRWESDHTLGFGIWHMWPLAWFAAWCKGAVPLLHLSRLFMLAVLWMNVCLMTLACGVKWRSRTFLWIVLGAASLVPLWDYGFEVRHDNLLLAFLLMGWVLLRAGSSHPIRRVVALGALAAVMQFITFKAFVYWVPLVALPLIWPPQDWRMSRGRVFLWGIVGLVGASLLLALAIAVTGRWSHFVNSLVVALGVSLKPPTRILPWGTLGRWAQQTPMLLAIAVAALVHTALRLRGAWKQEHFWEGVMPEGMMLLVVFLPLLIHPMPLPYHLCLVVPFAFVLGVRWLSLHASEWLRGGALWPLWGGLLVFTHGIPFLSYAFRHTSFTNERQETLVEYAEMLTQEGRDRVYDAAGLVSSRKSIGKQWFLHTLLLDQLASGKLPPVRDMLKANPAVVIIPNYRFGWLQSEDVEFIRKHYVSLADDFLVLGQVVSPQGGTFECLHGGEYLVSPHGDGVTGPQKLYLDEVPIQPSSIHQLSPGNHTLRTDSGQPVLVRWVGPNLKQPSSLGQGEGSRVFVNWY